MTDSHRQPVGSRGRRARAGYTLVELVFTMTLIVVLMALTLVTVGSMMKQARLATERQYIGALKLGVEQFKQSFGFYPPLVTAVVGDRALLQGAGADPSGVSRYLQDENNPRASVYSLPVYLMGSAGRFVDGYDGAGQGRPKPDGTWDTGAPRTEPFIDPSRDRERLQPAGQFSQLVDRWGSPIYYFRWEPTMHPKFIEGGALNPQFGEVKSANIPYALYNAAEDRWADKANSAAGLRAAAFAIVSPGPDGRISFERSTEPGWYVNDDNLMETGR